MRRNRLRPSTPTASRLPRPARPVALALAVAALTAGCAVPGTTATPASAEDAAPTSDAASATAEGSAAAASTSVPATAPGDVDDPASAAVVVNKARPLDPADWAPEELVPAPNAVQEDRRLRPEAAAAAEELFAAAAAEGHALRTISAYRSYATQQSTYDGWVASMGRTEADRVSARPGHSEHQTGLAMDVGDAAHPDCDLESCFGDTPAGRWVAEHAAEHGFIVRYPAGAEDVTGYSPEPWHLRWVGAAAARDVVAAGGVLETAWGLPAAPDYLD